MKTTILCLFVLIFFTRTSLISQNTVAEEGLDKLFHTADIEGETATQANKRKPQRTQILPEGSYRIGCECMTGEVRNTTSVGSCSGQGGVRYWIVLNAEGDTLLYPTARQALNTDKEPKPYIGPNPHTRYSTQPPTIIIMPPQANGLTPQYGTRHDSQTVMIQPLPMPQDSSGYHSNGQTALFGLPLLMNSLIQLCMILVICGTLVLIVRQFMQQPDAPGGSTQKIFKKIRLTLIKVLFRNNRFFR